MTDYILVPVEPTPEMVEAAEEAHMPFGDMELAIRLALLAAPDHIADARKMVAAAVQGEPVAWIVRHPHFCGKFTDDKEIAAHWESKKQGCTTPLFHCSQPAEQQPAPDVAGLVEALESLLEMQDEDCRYDHQGYCQNHNLDHVDDGCRVARAKTALAAHRKQGGE